MAAPAPRQSTPTPSRCSPIGVGPPTDGGGEEPGTASAGESSSAEEGFIRNRNRIRAKFHEEQDARHRKEQEARSAPQLPPVAEEDAEQAELGATAAPGVADTQQPASTPSSSR